MPAFASDGDGQATTRRLEALPLHRPSYDLSMYERVIVVARHAENVSWAAGVAANWAGNWATGDAGQIGAVEGRGHAGGEEGGEEVGDTTSDIGRAALGDGWGNTTRATGHAAKPAIFVVYEKANPHSRYNVPVNRGAEASAYLKYVLDHYDGLPRWSFFVHGNESSWHHDGKLGERLAHAWRLARDTGRPYVEINNYRQRIGLDKARGPLVGAGELEREMSAAQLEAWRREYLEPHVDFGRANADWVRGSTCCAQFLVRREQLMQYPRPFHERLYAWSIEPGHEGPVVVRYLEFAWHVIWGDDEARHPDRSQHLCGRGHARLCTRFEMAARREQMHDEDEDDGMQDEL